MGAHKILSVPPLTENFEFLIASMQCVSDLKKDFVVVGVVGVVVVVVVLDAELLSTFPRN